MNAVQFLLVLILGCCIGAILGGFVALRKNAHVVGGTWVHTSFLQQDKRSQKLLSDVRKAYMLKPGHLPRSYVDIVHDFDKLVEYALAKNYAQPPPVTIETIRRNIAAFRERHTKVHVIRCPKSVAFFHTMLDVVLRRKGPHPGRGDVVINADETWRKIELAAQNLIALHTKK